MNIIITGASRGIGKAFAGIFAANGYHLFLTSRSEVALYKAMEELQAKYPSIIIKAKAFDLAKKEQAINFGKWCLGFGVPDILINNAGGFEPGSIFNERDGLLEDQLAINISSAYHVTRTLLPAMMERKGGHIFNMCSIAALKAYPNGGSYSISKYAMHGFSKNLREELKAFHIKVTTVFPGAVLTDSWGDFDNSSDRIMVADDIAKMVYAASQLSPGASVEENRKFQSGRVSNWNLFFDIYSLYLYPTPLAE
jgi:short-subunit dehydrogenase